MAVSLANETNVPTVNFFLSACSSWFCMNSRNCIIKIGVVTFVLTLTISSLGTRNGNHPRFCVRRYSNDSRCFAASTTLLRSCTRRLDCEINVPDTQARGQVVDHVIVVVDFWFELQLPRQIRDF